MKHAHRLWPLCLKIITLISATSFVNAFASDCRKAAQVFFAPKVINGEVVANRFGITTIEKMIPGMTFELKLVPRGPVADGEWIQGSFSSLSEDGKLVNYWDSAGRFRQFAIGESAKIESLRIGDEVDRTLVGRDVIIRAARGPIPAAFGDVASDRAGQVVDLNDSWIIFRVGNREAAFDRDRLGVVGPMQERIDPSPTLIADLLAIRSFSDEQTRVALSQSRAGQGSQLARNIDPIGEDAMAAWNGAIRRNEGLKVALTLKSGAPVTQDQSRHPDTWLRVAGFVRDGNRVNLNPSPSGMGWAIDNKPVSLSEIRTGLSLDLRYRVYRGRDRGWVNANVVVALEDIAPGGIEILR